MTLSIRNQELTQTRWNKQVWIATFIHSFEKLIAIFSDGAELRLNRGKIITVLFHDAFSDKNKFYFWFLCWIIILHIRTSYMKSSHGKD